MEQECHYKRSQERHKTVHIERRTKIRDLKERRFGNGREEDEGRTGRQKRRRGNERRQYQGAITFNYIIREKKGRGITEG